MNPRLSELRRWAFHLNDLADSGGTLNDSPRDLRMFAAGYQELAAAEALLTECEA